MKRLTLLSAVSMLLTLIFASAVLTAYNPGRVEGAGNPAVLCRCNLWRRQQRRCETAQYSATYHLNGTIRYPFVTGGSGTLYYQPDGTVEDMNGKPVTDAKIPNF